jgi:hypothetical protein
MKKITTLLASLALVTIAIAQPGRDYGNNGYGGYDKGKDISVNVDLGRRDKDFNDFYYFSPQQKDMEIAMINRETDRKIQSIKSRFFMSRGRKMQAIWDVENESRFKIEQVNKKFFSRKNMYNGGPRKHW